jgi:phosphate transport system protein
MTRSVFDQRIDKLKQELLLLGSMVETATLDAVTALKDQDVVSARRIYHEDELINQKRYEIESAALVAIATQHPLAHDLRVLAAILEISTELERMGDYAKGIARIAIDISDQPHRAPLIHIPRMAEIAVDMLHRGLAYFIAEDHQQARLLPKDDDQVDALYKQVHRDLLKYMIEDPDTVDRTNHLLWAAHNLERLADRVTNICERTVFVATAEMIELDVTYLD